MTSKISFVPQRLHQFYKQQAKLIADIRPKSLTFAAILFYSRVLHDVPRTVDPGFPIFI